MTCVVTAYNNNEQYIELKRSWSRKRESQDKDLT